MSHESSCLQKSCPSHDECHHALRRSIDAQFDPVRVLLLEQGKLNLATDVQEEMRESIIDTVCERMFLDDSILDQESIPADVLAHAERELRKVLLSLFPGRPSLLRSLTRFFGCLKPRVRRKEPRKCDCVEGEPSVYSAHAF